VQNLAQRGGGGELFFVGGGVVEADDRLAADAEQSLSLRLMRSWGSALPG